MLRNVRIYSAIWLLCALSLFGTQRVQAQAVTAEAYVHAIGGWNLVEVKSTAGEVMGFWGIPRVAVEVGNIRRLWFEVTQDDDWSVYAFEPVAIQARVQNLLVDGASRDSMSFLMYQEFLAADTAVNQDIDGGVDGLVVKGFISGDPLTEAAGSLDDPDTMINILADVGYPVAPDLSGLLVDGTAGASVGMNPATKQTLDCLRSFQNACGDCVCIKVEGPMTPSPWTVIETELEDGRLRCEFSRTEHHQYWQFGEDPDNACVDCTAGSAENPILYDVVVDYTEIWADEEQCPDAPLFH